MIARFAVGLVDEGLGQVVRAEQLRVQLGILVARGLVRKEPQGLVIPDGPAHLGVDIGLQELRAPVAVVGADETGNGDVVQQAGEDDLLALAALLGQPRALHQMRGGAEA